MTRIFFHNREEGARLLADQLVRLRREGKLWETSQLPLVILAIPRGGVVTGQIIASILGAKFDILISEKIVSPYNFNITIGAVIHDGTFYSLPVHREVENEEEKNEEDMLTVLKPRHIVQQVSHIVKRIQPRIERFRSNIKYNLNNKTVILVDDGIATGATMCAAAQWVRRQKPKQLIVAVPVASKESIDMLKRMVDMVIVIHRSSYCYSIEEHYGDFREVSDDEVERIIKNRHIANQYL
jgi:putative phosphoribosyl transferase